jgi:hypothetical protein
MNIKLRSLLAAVVALSLAVPGIASADRRGDGRHGYGDRHGYTHGYGYKGKYHDRYYGYRGHHDRYITNYYSQDNDDDDLLVGLLVGGVLGYAINGAQHSNAYYYNAH